jgi:hypothetical protein
MVPTDIQKIFDEFNTARGYFPQEAVNVAIQMKDEITPYLIALIREAAENYSKVHYSRMDHLFALFLLAKFREPLAFPYVMQIAMLPDEWSEKLLGDCVTEDLPALIVSTYNGDWSGIKAIIENIYINIWLRSAALKSLLGLVAINRLSRDEVIAYLKTVFQLGLTKNNDLFAAMLVDTACCLWPGELYAEIKNEFEQKNVDESYIDEKWFEKMFKLDKEDCLKDNVCDDKYFCPSDDMYDSLSSMNAFMPVKVGRNDKCICGSEKKYKKCCLSKISNAMNATLLNESLSEIPF